MLLAGIVANLAAYIPSSLADHTALNAREFAPVLPFAAVLAARALGDRLGARAAAGRVLAASLVALFGWYCAGLAHQAAAPAAPDPFARLEAFLRQHHLTSGIGGYWDASVITVDTGGAVTVRAVTQGCLQPYAWESKPAWYDPAARHGELRARVQRDRLLRPVAGVARRAAAAGAAAARAPATRLLHPGDGYTVRAYRGNLLAQLPRWPAANRAAGRRPLVMNVPRRR